ncbi:hypothetical protein KC327_g19318, partial [Hortaea werneckii]
MKHMAAYLLLGLGGNTSPSANDIKEVLASVGVEAEQLDRHFRHHRGKIPHRLLLRRRSPHPDLASLRL